MNRNSINTIMSAMMITLLTVTTAQSQPQIQFDPEFLEVWGEIHINWDDEMPQIPWVEYEPHFFTVHNSGDEPLLVENITTDLEDDWWLFFEPFPYEFEIAPGEAQEIEILLDCPMEGETEFTITFHCNDPERREADLPALFYFEYNPHLIIRPGFIEEVLIQGEVVEVPITLINEDDDPVEFFVEGWIIDQPEGADGGWLMVEGEDDVVPPNDEVILNVILNAIDQPSGYYEAALSFITNDPDMEQYDVSIVMEVVLPEPNIVFNPDRLEIVTFINPFGGFDPDGFFSIANVGNVPLVVASIEPDVEWITVVPDQIELEPDQRREIGIWLQPDEPMEPGDYEAAILIRSNDPDLPLFELPVNITILGPPSIVVDPVAIEYTGMIGQVEEHVLNLANIGDADLRFVISSRVIMEPEGNNAEWLTFDPSEGEIRGDQDMDIIVTLDPTGAMGGEYETELCIMNNDPENPEVVVLVYMEVHGVPEIQVTWDEIAGYPELINWNMVFEDVFTGGPYEIPVTISNSGTGALMIEDITVNHEYFTTDFIEELSLEVGEEIEVTTTFCAPAEDPGEYDAVMTLRSNDPDEEVFEVNLHANAFDPPEIRIDPLNIEERMFVGEMNENMLEVSNSGGSVLRFRIEHDLIHEPEQDRIPRRDQPEARFGLFAQADPWGYDLERIFQAVDDLDYERFRGGEAFNEVDFFDFDVFWFGNFQPDEWIELYNDNLERIEDWVDQGGVYYMCTSTSDWGIVPVHPGGLVRLGRYGENTGIAVVGPDENYLMELMDWEEGQQFHARDFCHTGYTIESLENIRNNNDVQVMVIGQEQEIPVVVEYNFGLGRCVVSGTTDGYMHDDPDRYEWGRCGEAMLWYLDFLTDYNWLTYEPREGEIEPGEDLDICVTLDASGRLGGEYQADLHFLSNDPDDFHVVVSVSMTVGDDWGPAIFWSEEYGYPDVINFNWAYGELFVGETYSIPVEIVNAGVNDLVVEEIECEMEFFRAEPEELIIEPGEDAEFEVIFEPDEAGEHVGVLEIMTNDPDDEIWEVFVAGECDELHLRHFPELDYPEITHSLTVTDIQFNGEFVETGWEVGVFTPGGTIAGSGIWIEGEDLEMQTLADDQETEEVEGFRAGESFTFRLWDDVVDQEYDAIGAHFEEGPEIWVPRGESILSLLGENWGFRIEMRRGWNLVSINFDPIERYYAPGEVRGPDIELMMEQFLIDEENFHLLLMKDENGNFYVPPGFWYFLNIPYWNLTEGYHVKLDQDFVAEWQGVRILPDADVPLENGWNMAAYFPDYELPCNHPDYYAFSSILDNLIIAKDEDGNFCLPEFNFSDLPPLSPGKGYQIKVDDDVILNYPPEADEEMIASTGFNHPVQWEQHWQKPHPTGVGMSVLITEIEGYNHPAGDQIGIFGPVGIPVGTGLVDETGRCGIAVWGDDPTTEEVDGLRPGEHLTLRLWDRNSRSVIPLDVVTIAGGSGSVYRQDTFIVLSVVAREVIPTEYSLSQNYPNPFNSTTCLDYGLPEASEISLVIYDLKGRQVKRLVNGYQEAGYHRAVITADNMTSGVYAVRLTSPDYSASRKIILLR